MHVSSIGAARGVRNPLNPCEWKTTGRLTDTVAPRAHLLISGEMRDPRQRHGRSTSQMRAGRASRQTCPLPASRAAPAQPAGA